jgi:hypothetical protein
MAILFFLAMLSLLGIQMVQARKARKLHCEICGRKTGLWHIEPCHRRYVPFPSVNIVFILVLILAGIFAFGTKLR